MLSGATAAWILPLSLAYIGDVVPYDQRQQVLGRFLAGQVLGQLFGQAAGGIIGDYFGWRAMFFVLAAMLAIAAVALAYELATNPLTRVARDAPQWPGLLASYKPCWPIPGRACAAGGRASKATLLQGVFPYVGADLHLRFGLSFTAIGLVIGIFAHRRAGLCGDGAAADAPARPGPHRQRRRRC